MNLEKRIQIVRAMLPSSYEVKESKQSGNIHAKSDTGIPDEKEWEKFMNGLRDVFDDFLEVFHNTCHNHVDITIYFDQK